MSYRLSTRFNAMKKQVFVGTILLLSIIACSPVKKYEVKGYSYTIQKTGVKYLVIDNNNYKTESNMIVGQKIIYDNPPKTITLSFNFITDNYFIDNNYGHFAIGIRGDSETDTDNDGKKELRGRGVIIGSVQLYSTKIAECRHTSSANRVAIESFWSNGNCVYGETSESQKLVDKQLYNIKISSILNDSNQSVISYELYKIIDEKKILLTSKSIIETNKTTAPRNQGGFWIAEAFSTHDWKITITDISYFSY